MQTHDDLCREIKTTPRSSNDYMMMIGCGDSANLCPLVHSSNRHMPGRIRETIVDVLRQCGAIWPHIDNIFDARNFHETEISGSFFHLSSMDHLSIEIFSSKGMSRP